MFINWFLEMVYWNEGGKVDSTIIQYTLYHDNNGMYFKGRRYGTLME